MLHMHNTKHLSIWSIVSSQNQFTVSVILCEWIIRCVQFFTFQCRKGQFFKNWNWTGNHRSPLPKPAKTDCKWKFGNHNTSWHWEYWQNRLTELKLRSMSHLFSSSNLLQVSRTNLIFSSRSLAICHASGCTVAPGVIVVSVCNCSQTRTSKCTCLIFGVSIGLDHV